MLTRKSVFPGSFTIAAQTLSFWRRELAGPDQRSQFRIPAYARAVEKNLGHRAAPISARHHGAIASKIVGNVNVVVLIPQAGQQFFCCAAKAAPVFGIDLDFRNQVGGFSSKGM
jgi:hypothetical protein